MPLFWSIKLLIIYTLFLVCWQIYPSVGEELTRDQISLSLVHSLSSVLSLSLYLSLSLPQCIFLSLPRNQSCFSLVRCHCRWLSNISLPEFLLVSFSIATPAFLVEASSSFSFYNWPHQSLQDQSWKNNFVGYATIVVAGAKSLCRSFF